MASEGTPGAAYRCLICGNEPLWSITRRGDVAMTWADPEHLSAVCERLQRDHEVTELVVKLMPKAHEWAQMGERLRQITEEETS